MRLHRLTVSAFGPFAGTETVDFDELNDAGLFLLTGPTGAGKSSLLDAVCFALYGTVPGARGVKTLKSQHAAVDAAPEVVLDFTVRDRRFVVRRTPEWSRPKKRGEGLLTEKASASITETTSGSDHFLSARAAEVGLLVGDLMGMTSTQFVQVALLPQGEFQTFLRASSQERHDVLQHLFRTDRFARIEDWVHDHSRDLTDRADRGRSTVQRLLDSVADRADTTTPEELSHDALAQAAADGRVLPWAQERLTEAEQAAADTGRLHDATRLRLTAAVTRHAAAVRWREQAARRAEAEAAQRRLAEQEDVATRTRELLEAAERATRCRPLLALLDRSVADDESARSDRERALRALDAATSGALVDPSAAELADVAEETRARITRLETLLPREAAAAEATRELAATDARLVAAEADLARATTRAAELPADVERLTTSLREATARAVRRPEIALSLAAATERLAAAEDLVAAEAEVVRLTDAHRDARDLALTAREHRQDLLARRLAGMAAELAGRLADGDACQVCGSTSHPRPATADQDAVTEADQDAAEREVLACGERLEEARRSLQSAEHRRAELDRARGGLSAAEARGEVVSLTDDLVDARAAADEQSALEDALARLRGEEQRLSGHLTSTSAAIAALRERVVGLRETLAAVAAELDGVSAGGTDGSLRDQVEDLRTRLDLVERTRQVVQAADTAAALVVDRSREAGTAANEAGFATADDARAALLPAPDDCGLRDRLEQRAREAARVAAVLADTDAPDTDAPETDLTGLTAALHDAEESAALAARRQHLAEERVGALHSLVGRLCTAIDSWAPLRDESLRAQSMSKLVRGMGQDNQLQMRLSAYVLATRLDQVVAAANERLGQMRDQRYLLQRTDRAARKGTQAGLGLEIVDQWTGDARDPATLSGGETFVVSLSLALGLADVVTQEAGGTEIETLFVDEGFGTLDADTLDDVMDRLDGLRAGGRTVGVVSHVSELRNRIPTQVHVEKGRAGSTVTVATLVG